MLVKELIEKLKGFDQDLPVYWMEGVIDPRFLHDDEVQKGELENERGEEIPAIIIGAG
jgi:hypothetical protein